MLELSSSRVEFVVISLERGKSPDWDAMDGGEAMHMLPTITLERPIFERLRIHLGWMRIHPLRYCKAAWQAVRLHHGAWPRAARQFFRAIILAYEARRLGIEHLHAGFANHLANITCLAAGLLGIPYSLAAHAHDIWAERPLTPVMNGATCCVACTRAGRDTLAKNYPDANVALVRHGVSLSARRGWDESPEGTHPPGAELRLIAAGRFVPKKGLADLVEACHILKQQGCKFSCDIYGEGPLKEELQKRIHTAGLDLQVRLYPFLAHRLLMERLGAAHLCVLPCRVDPQTGDRDGVPNLLLEAMARGTIILGGDLPALREIIEHRVTGYLAPPERPSELARVIGMAWGDWDQWPRIRHEARQMLIHDYDNGKNIVSFLASILQSSDRPPAIGRNREENTWK